MESQRGGDEDLSKLTTNPESSSMGVKKLGS
jgi:hypothetical protein